MTALLRLIVWSAAAAIETMGDFLDSTQWARHSHEVVERLDDVKSLLLDAETGMRTYIITGQPEHLAPFDAAEDGLRQGLDDLGSALADNPQQSEGWWR